MQENNWVITTKKGKGKLPIFCGNRERVIPIYGAQRKHAFWGEIKEMSKTKILPSINKIDL